jgi:tetratricopeptide (TPR) repeat protein
MNGNLAETAKARARIAWFGASKAEDDPTVQLVDAGLLLASGLPEKALDLATKLDGVRPRLIRAYALLDLGKAKEAIAEADAVLEQAPENVEAELLRQQARAIGLDGKERLAAADELEKLARRAKSKLGRHALGMALLGMGDTKGAQSQLEQAVADVNETSPNPLAYRTHTALAELLLAADDLEGARAQLEKALAVNSGYFPTLALQAKVALRVGDADRALDLLMPIFNEQAAVTPGLELTLAEALIVSKKSTAKQKEQAKEILGRIKDKVPAAELGRVAALLDPKLAEELGGASSEAAPAPEPAKAPTKAPAKAPAKKAPKTTRKRGRR